MFTHKHTRRQILVFKQRCAAAGLNSHVNSECLPCSQWLSSAATGLQPACGSVKVREGQQALQMSITLPTSTSVLNIDIYISKQEPVQGCTGSNTASLITILFCPSLILFSSCILQVTTEQTLNSIG
ncbi:hypothetical protein AMECASPLE_004365 [Ameca splendens]|uniref:Uncharacterized protein n=1 Tax=Ameca splendens TaxID=208324 RepID=A0ABV0ZWT5_9TELE